MVVIQIQAVPWIDAKYDTDPTSYFQAILTDRRIDIITIPIFLKRINVNM